MSYIFGSENFVKTYMFGSSFLLVQVYSFGFSLGWKLIFWINLAYNKGFQAVHVEFKKEDTVKPLYNGHPL